MDARGRGRTARGRGALTAACERSSMSPISSRSSATVRRSVDACGTRAARRALRERASGTAEVFPGKLSAPPHCHTLEEEIFVVLEGDGHLLLWDKGEVEEHAVRTGSVVVRPPGPEVAHAFRGGEAGMTLLMYGTREPGEVCYYPRSGKVYFIGLGLITRVGEQLDYWEGED